MFTSMEEIVKVTRKWGRHASWVAVALGAAACGGSSGGAGGAQDAEDGGTSTAPSSADASVPTHAEAGGCTVDSDCAALVPPTNPPGCAVGRCDPTNGTCSFVAQDADGDGHPAADCASTSSVPVQKGDDCDDHDPKLYPGHGESCSATAQGQTITWPDGAPVGACQAGQVTCLADGTKSACTGAVAPAARDCASKNDNDCDGLPDSSECTCQLGASQACYTGPPGTEGAGKCASGTQTCEAADGGTAWGACTGQKTPAGRDCTSAADNDCDGKADDTECGPCTPGATQSCYTGLAGTAGVGVCKAGTQTCALSGSVAAWGSCTGEVTPAATHNCSSAADNDCNGKADDTECGPCVAGATESCYSGPAGTEGQGICHGGTETCVLNGVTTSWNNTCDGQVTPAAISCGSSADNDCDGTADIDDAACQCSPGYGPNSTQACTITDYCGSGAITCNAGSTSSSWSACSGPTVPSIHTTFPGSFSFTDGTKQDTLVASEPAPSGAIPYGGNTYEFMWSLSQSGNVDNTHGANDSSGPAAKVECADGSSTVNIGSEDFSSASNPTFILCPLGVGVNIYKWTNWGGGCCGGYTRTFSSLEILDRGCP